MNLRSYKSFFCSAPLRLCAKKILVRAEAQRRGDDAREVNA